MWYAYLVKIIVWTPETIHVGTNTSNVWNVKYVKYIYIYIWKYNIEKCEIIRYINLFSHTMITSESLFERKYYKLAFI